MQMPFADVEPQLLRLRRALGRPVVPFYLSRYVRLFDVQPKDAANIALASRRRAHLNDKALMAGGR
ncbi:MAG: hypothetical protein R2755_08555 [Acidimicrobiales bacterium]